MREGAIFYVQKNGDSWVLTALNAESVTDSAIDSGTPLGVFGEPNEMCREITNHVSSLSGSESRQSSGGEQRV